MCFSLVLNSFSNVFQFFQRSFKFRNFKHFKKKNQNENAQKNPTRYASQENKALGDRAFNNVIKGEESRDLDSKFGSGALANNPGSAANSQPPSQEHSVAGALERVKNSVGGVMDSVKNLMGR